MFNKDVVLSMIFSILNVTFVHKILCGLSALVENHIFLHVMLRNTELIHTLLVKVISSELVNVILITRKYNPPQNYSVRKWNPKRS